MVVDLALIALAIGAMNGFVGLVKPIPRLHSRLDVLEAKIDSLQRQIDRLGSD